MSYFVWTAQPGKGHCVLLELENFEGIIDLKRGRGGAKAATFPKDARLRMDPKFSKYVKLADQISNLDRLIVVSPALQTAVRALNVPGVELLSLTILDHKSRVATDEYAIVNPFVVQDCIDKDASALEWNTIDPTLISYCPKLVLNEIDIRPEFPIFRPKHMEMFVIVRGDVAVQLADMRFSGMSMDPVATFEY